MEGSREEGLLEESALGEEVRVILAEVIKNGNINLRSKDKARQGEPRGRIPAAVDAARWKGHREAAERAKREIPVRR